MLQEYKYIQHIQYTHNTYNTYNTYNTICHQPDMQNHSVRAMASSICVCVDWHPLLSSASGNRPDRRTLRIGKVLEWRDGGGDRALWWFFCFVVIYHERHGDDGVRSVSMRGTRSKKFMVGQAYASTDNIVIRSRWGGGPRDETEN